MAIVADDAEPANTSDVSDEDEAPEPDDDDDDAEAENLSYQKTVTQRAVKKK